MGITASDRRSGEAPGRDSPLREELEAEGWTEWPQHVGILVLGQGVRDPSGPKMFGMEGIGCHHHRRAEGQGTRTLKSPPEGLISGQEGKRMDCPILLQSVPFK